MSAPELTTPPRHPYGAKVDYFITGGGQADEGGSGIVIGQIAGSPDVWIVADGRAHGMSINGAWCKVRGWDIPMAARWRKRYVTKYTDEHLRTL